MDEYGYVVNVDGVVARGDEYLLIERGADEDHAPGTLGLPGGKLEAPPGTDHALETAARREIEEEVGVAVGTVEYVCSGTFEADTGHECLNVVTLCEYEGGEARARATEEVAAVRWLTLAEIREHGDVPAYTETYVERAEADRNGN
ncbi:MAG: NUDIX hydrolase [Halosimplex sp.]